MERLYVVNCQAVTGSTVSLAQHSYPMYWNKAYNREISDSPGRRLKRLTSGWNVHRKQDPMQDVCPREEIPDHLYSRIIGKPARLLQKQKFISRRRTGQEH